MVTIDKYSKWGYYTFEGIRYGYEGGDKMYPNIDAERARNNLTQEDLATLLGISLKTFQNWISGKTAIPCTALIKMAGLWGVSTDYLLGLPNKK